MGSQSPSGAYGCPLRSGPTWQGISQNRVRWRSHREQSPKRLKRIQGKGIGKSLTWGVRA